MLFLGQAALAHSEASWLRQLIRLDCHLQLVLRSEYHFPWWQLPPVLRWQEHYRVVDRVTVKLMPVSMPVKW